ncbi:S8 family serine peptidase [Kordia sp.]|uniref:S8 family serine peptidase n=1 Tax=Kordia sp. TaxID=1965332 RepID=UPI003B5A9607
MKKVIVYCFALLLMTLVGCQKETLHLEETEIAKETEITQKGGASNTADTRGNELVILYEDGTTEAEKVLKRAEHNVESYKKCECADPNLELWIFSKGEVSGDGGLEEKKHVIRSGGGVEGADYNPNIKIQDDVFIDFGGFGSTEDALLKRVSANQGVTVAILDTGVMYDYPGFSSPFLYNSGQDACSNNGYDDMFGWNFVDEDNNPYDNHTGRHGTIVSSLIASKFENANIDYQILPVKVASRTGNIRYFDGLCGFQYAAKKPGVNIINMSFGWYNHERELLEKFILDAEDILVITSAGNDGINNDTTPHYPSSYDSDNILAIAALGARNSQGSNTNANIGGSFVDLYGSATSNTPLASFSNRGLYSVDIAAPGEHIPFSYNHQTLYINGTSYSAALASGYSGTLYQSGMSGAALRTSVITNSVYDPDLSEIQYAKHIPE